MCVLQLPAFLQGENTAITRKGDNIVGREKKISKLYWQLPGLGGGYSLAAEGNKGTFWGDGHIPSLF